jgi:hypothetical protein
MLLQRSVAGTAKLQSNDYDADEAFGLHLLDAGAVHSLRECDIAGSPQRTVRVRLRRPHLAA